MLPPANVHLGWELNQRVDMHVYLTTSPNGDVFSNQWTSGWRQNRDKDLPHFVWENLTFGNWKDSRIVEMDIKFPEVSILLCGRSTIYSLCVFSLLECSTEWVAVGGRISCQGWCKPQPSAPWV
jgi:hypothetical protein